MESPWPLARRRAELAFRARLAARRRRAAVRLLSRGERRVAIAAVPAARRARGGRDAEVLFAHPQRPPAARQAQSAAEARGLVHHPPARAVGPYGVRGLQADAAVLAWKTARRVPGRALLALLGRVDLHRLSARARRSRVRRRPGIVARHDQRMVSREVPRSEEHTSELQSHSFISYAVFCLKKK